MQIINVMDTATVILSDFTSTSSLGLQRKGFWRVPLRLKLTILQIERGCS